MTTNPADDLRSKLVTREVDDAIDTIIANDERQLPIILEDQFIREVLPILVCPWTPERLEPYRKYVGEFTSPLRVASNERNPKVLFVVPPLYPRVTTSVAASGDTVSISHVVDHVVRMRERDPSVSFDHVTDFIKAISATRSVEDAVLKPVARILAQYGRVFEDEDGNPLYRLEGGGIASLHSTTTPAAVGSLFGDESEYED